MPKGKNANLTVAPESLYPNDDDSTMHVPPEVVTSVISNLAGRTGLTDDQIRLTLTALASLAQEQVCSPGNWCIDGCPQPISGKDEPVHKKGYRDRGNDIAADQIRE